MKKKENNKKKLKKKHKPLPKPGFKSPGATVKKNALTDYITKRQILVFSGFLVFCAAFIYLALAILVKAFAPVPIAFYLPAKSTILTYEINLNSKHRQFLARQQLLADYAVFSARSIDSYLAATFGREFKNSLTPWLGRSAGLAFLNLKNDNSTLTPLYFAEIGKRQKFNTYFASLKTESAPAIKKINENFFAISNGDYFFFSENRALIAELADFFLSDELSLARTPAYDKVSDNSPLNKMAFLFLNYKAVGNNFLQPLGLEMEQVAPFTASFEAEGLTFFEQNGELLLNDYLTHPPVTLKRDGLLNPDYQADFTRFAPDSVIFFWGSQNLGLRLDYLLQVFSAGSSGAYLLFNEIIQNYVTEYFGEEVDFRQDLLPLFTKEFALMAFPGKDQNALAFVADVESEKIEKIKSLLEKFSNLGGLSRPKVVERVLQDGTVSRELIAEPAIMKREKKSYRNIDIFTLLDNLQNQGFYYSFAGEKFILTNTLSSLEKILDLHLASQKATTQDITAQNPATQKQNLSATDNQQDGSSLKSKTAPVSLLSSAIFRDQISPVLAFSQEVAYLNFRELAPLFFKEKPLPPFLKPLKSLSFGKKYYSNGVDTKHFIFLEK